MPLKNQKYEFWLLSVDHTINQDGLHTPDMIVEVILKAPAPRDAAELRSFLGLDNYYGKFLPDFATVLSSLYLLLQKKWKLIWSAAQGKAFNK